MESSRNYQNKNAFTLIELLVTISIIGILAALSLQAGKRIFEKHREVTCIGQLGRVYSVMRLYALDNNNCFPRSYFSSPSWANWFGDSPLSSYADGKDSWEKIVICPSNRTPAVIPATARKGYPYTVNYNILRATAPASEYAQISAPALTNASQTILMLDSKASGQWGIGFNSKASGWTRANNSHYDKANVLWADGHVSSTNLIEITDQNIIPTSL